VKTTGQPLGYHFKSSDCKIIESLDESGTPVPLGLETLSPQILSKSPGYDPEGNRL
jgi:hypothetical protein